MRLLVAGLSAIGTALAYKGTHPVLAWTSAEACSPRVVHVHVGGLHADDLTRLASSNIQSSYQQAAKRHYEPYVNAEDSFDFSLQKLKCNDAEESYVELETLREGKARHHDLEMLDVLVGTELQQVSQDTLVVLSSHPHFFAKRQLLEPDQEEIIQALEQLTDDDANTPVSLNTEDNSVQLTDRPSINKGADIAEHDDSDYLEVIATSTSPTSTSLSAYQQQTSSPSTSSSGSVIPSQLPSNASLVAKYAIVTPNLIVATLLFLLVFFPAAWLSISALGGIDLPYGLETKMVGSISQDRKDQ